MFGESVAARQSFVLVTSMKLKSLRDRDSLSKGIVDGVPVTADVLNNPLVPNGDCR
jgi:hypothetical protein